MTSASIPIDSPSSQAHAFTTPSAPARSHPPSPDMPHTPSSAPALVDDIHSENADVRDDKSDKAADDYDPPLHHGAGLPAVQLENRNSGLPSPPLTRASTDESGFQSNRAPDDDEEGVPGGEDPQDEADITDWDPLSHSRASLQDPDNTQNATIVENAEANLSEPHTLNDEKPEPISSRYTPSPFKMDLKPPSPQPWELIEPPPGNGHGPDFYSTVGTKHSDLLARKPRPPIPHSSYYVGPPPVNSAYGTPPKGQIGVHHPREILRVERDYTGGELIQFTPTYPLELEGRITPTQFLETVNSINELLISAHSLRHSFFDNFLAVFTLQLSTLVITTHYEKEMRRLQQVIEQLNVELYNPVGLNILWPRKVAFLFLEIEYY